MFCIEGYVKSVKNQGRDTNLVEEGGRSRTLQGHPSRCLPIYGGPAWNFARHRRGMLTKAPVTNQDPLDRKPGSWKFSERKELLG